MKKTTKEKALGMSSDNYIRQLERKVSLLEKKLGRAILTLKDIEDKKDRYDRKHDSTVKSLEEQKSQLDKKNRELETTKRDLMRKNLGLQIASSTDSLTKTFNRQKLNEIIDYEIDQSERYVRDLCIIITDIDHFKHVNDTYGHLAGDTVLISATQFFQDALRKTDSLGRWGGEEFLIVCPSTKGSSAIMLAEKLRLGLSTIVYPEGFSITASFGVAEYLPSDSRDTLIKKADEALYLAKKRRNCAYIYEPKIIVSRD